MRSGNLTGTENLKNDIHFSLSKPEKHTKKFKSFDMSELFHIKWLILNELEICTFSAIG